MKRLRALLLISLLIPKTLLAASADWNDMTREQIVDEIRENPMQPRGWWWLFKGYVGLHEHPETSGLDFNPDLQTSGEFYEDALSRLERGDTPGATIQLRNAIEADASNLSAYLKLAEIYSDQSQPAAARHYLEEARSQGAGPALIVEPLAQAMLDGEAYAELLDALPLTSADRELRPRLLVMHARAHVGLRQYPQAEAKLTQAINADPDLVEAHIEMARLRVLEGRLDDARAQLVSMERTGRYHPDFWLIRGEIAHLQEDYEAALAAFDEALGLDENHRLALSAAADINLKLGRTEAATAFVDRLRQAHPNDLRGVLLELAMLSDDGGDSDRLAIALAGARDLIEDLDYGKLQEDPASLFVVGSIHHISGRMTEAAALLSQYLEYSPGDLNAVRLLVTARLALGQPENALSALRAARRHGEGNADLTLLYARAHIAAKQFDEALPYLDRYIEARPDDRSARLERARANASLARYDVALEELDALLAEKEDTAIRRTQANVLLALGEYDRLLQSIATWPPALRGSADADVIRGQALLGKRDFDGAATALRAALEKDPDSAAARFNLAVIDRRRGNTEAAEAAFKEILRKHREHRPSMLQLSEIARVRGDRLTAIDYLKSAVALRPGIVDSLTLVELLLENDRTQEARETLTELKLDYPNALEVLAAEARMNLAQDNRERARQIYVAMRVQAVERRQVAELVGIARAQFDIGDTQAAEVTLAEARALAPDRVDIMLLQADFDRRRESYESALATVREVVEQAPQNPEVYRQMAGLLVELGRRNEALETWQAGIEATDGNPVLVLGYYNALRAQQGPGPALAYLEGFVRERETDSYLVLRGLAGAYADADQIDKAIGLNETLLRIRPDDVIVLNNLALGYQAIGDERALETAQRAYEMAPDNYAVMDTLGWILVNEGELSLGLTILRNALVRAPRAAEIKYHYAVGLSRNGQEKTAEEELASLLREVADFPGRDEAEALYEALRAR